MSAAHDPPRLADGAAGAPEAVRELIAGAKQDVPSDHEVEKLAAVLAPLLWPTATAAGATGAVVAKVVAAVVATGAVVGGGLWLARSSAPPEVAPQPTPAMVPASPPAAPAAAPSAASSTEPEPAELEEDARSPKADKTVGPSEAQLLQAAQRALRSNPARALSLARQHQRRFPSGTLSQEREVIAIEALSRMGRSGEARGRAGRFKEQYPGSAHGRKVDTATDR